MNKHTQGEWRTEADNRGKYTFVYAHPNKFICAANGRQGSVDGDEFQNEANAKLVAAAPDLLEALKECYSLLESYHHSLPNSAEITRYLANAAIKKATE